jgi:hypothetical protein
LAGMSFLRSSRTFVGPTRFSPCHRSPLLLKRPLSWPRTASTEAPKPRPPPRRRTSDVYKERNRNLLMYSSAVVCLLLPSARCFMARADYCNSGCLLCRRSALPHVLRGNWFRGDAERWHRPL